MQSSQIGEELIDLREGLFERVPEIQKENVMKNPQPLWTLSKYDPISKALIKYSRKFLQKN
jgi:hypothetical protein